jgi:hypothetical protein
VAELSNQEVRDNVFNALGIVSILQTGAENEVKYDTYSLDATLSMAKALLGDCLGRLDQLAEGKP